MTSITPTFSVEVDLPNPGEYLACCGLLELADRLYGGAEGWFSGDGDFGLYVLGRRNPRRLHGSIAEILTLLGDAEVHQVAQNGLSPLLIGPPFDLRLDWWLWPTGSAPALKFWSGNQSSSGLFLKYQNALSEAAEDGDPFNYVSPTILQGDFGFDASIGWSSLDNGYSFNNKNLGPKNPVIRPVVEILSVVGLQRFVPHIEGDAVHYSTWETPMMPSSARAALGGGVRSLMGDDWRARILRRGNYKYIGFGQRVEKRTLNQVR